MINEKDWDAIDALYQRALEEEDRGDTGAAKDLLNRVLALDPDDHVGASLALARLTGTEPSKAPDAYVASLFDQVADRFDAILVDELGYAVPLMIADELERLKLAPFDRWLDLGCGTGLCGMALEDVTRHRIGLDLAPQMIEMASDLDIYQELFVGEAVRFLQDHAHEGSYNLITAADVLPYVGDLGPLFQALERCSQTGTLLAFSTEKLATEAEEFRIGEKKRFAHKSQYVGETLHTFGWETLSASEITVRTEEAVTVSGDLVVARRS